MGLRQPHGRGDPRRHDCLAVGRPRALLLDADQDGRADHFVGGPANHSCLYVSTSAFAGARLGGGNDDVFVASPRSLTGASGHPRRRGSRPPPVPALRHAVTCPPGQLRPGFRLAALRRPQEPSTSLPRHRLRERRRPRPLRADHRAAAATMRWWRGPATWSSTVAPARTTLGMLADGECGPGTRRSVFGGPGGRPGHWGSFDADLPWSAVRALTGPTDSTVAIAATRSSQCTASSALA